MQGEALARVGLLAVALSLWALPRAAAQADPEIPDAECVVTLGLDDGDPVRLEEFNLGQQMIVRDEAGCTPANAEVVAVLRGEPDDYRLGETTSEDDGGFLIRAQIPNEADYGTHLLVVDAGRERYTKAIQVVPKSASKPVDRVRVGAIAAAALLIVLGVAVLVVPSRARRRARRARSGRPGESDVPFIDTSGFVPQLEASREASNEADAENAGSDTTETTPPTA